MNYLKHLHSLSSILVAALMLLMVSADARRTTLFVIGDSTAAEKQHPDTNPERGWGMVLQGYFGKGVVVDNHAINGRSSKSFLDEGRWDKVLQRIKPGDYVLIQFGHNDEKPQPERHTDVGTTFDANLERYCRETREKGGIPVLLSCVARRNFFKAAEENDDDEKLRTVVYGDEEVNSDTLIDTHGGYKDAPRYVARRLGVTFIDANRLTHDLEQQMGVEASRRLHMWYKPGEVASMPQGRKDNTHYNVYGARIVARLIADALCKEVKPLKRHLVHYDYVVSAKGRGNYMTLAEAIKDMPQGKKVKVYVLDGDWTISKASLLGKKVKFDTFTGASVTVADVR